MENIKNESKQKFSETLGDAMRLSANLSELVKGRNDDILRPRNSDDSNTAASNPNQQVQIHIGDPENKKKEEPVVIHEKPETHIHKEFPDERALSDKECELALAKAKMEQEYKIREMEYNQYKYDQERQDRLAREAQKRKDDEEKRIKNEKKAKVRRIIGAVVAIFGAGYLGYSVYRDHRNNGTVQMDTTQTAPNPISAEGTVE